MARLVSLIFFINGMWLLKTIPIQDYCDKRLTDLRPPGQVLSHGVEPAMGILPDTPLQSRGVGVMKGRYFLSVEYFPIIPAPSYL